MYYSYLSPFRGAAYTIDELAEDLRRDLDGSDVFRIHKQVIFLCHSMGGLVVRAFLTRYRTQASKVPMVYFFSTPTTGAQIAVLGKLLSNNPQIGAMLPIGSADEYLASIQKDWLAANFPIASYCAYETQDIRGVRVVGEPSATNLCNRRLDPINADHINLVKPRDRSDASYISFRNAVLEEQEPKGGIGSVAPAKKTPKVRVSGATKVQPSTPSVAPPLRATSLQARIRISNVVALPMSESGARFPAITIYYDNAGTGVATGVAVRFGAGFSGGAISDETITEQQNTLLHWDGWKEAMDRRRQYEMHPGDLGEFTSIPNGEGTLADQFRANFDKVVAGASVLYIFITFKYFDPSGAIGVTEDCFWFSGNFARHDCGRGRTFPQEQ